MTPPILAQAALAAGESGARVAPLIAPDDVFTLWAVIALAVAAAIYLEQNYRWAARLSGPVIALVSAMVLTNVGVMPTESPVYGMVSDYLVPMAIPLLLLRGNLFDILGKTGGMFVAFHLAAIGTLLGAFLAAMLFQGRLEQLPELTGIMTGSYIGGGVNFFAVANSYEVDNNLTNPLLVADNFIMAGLFLVLLTISGSRFFLDRYPHPHSQQTDAEETERLAASYWKRKEISLLDIAKSLALALAIAATANLLSRTIKASVEQPMLAGLLGNMFVLTTFLTIGVATLMPRTVQAIHGPQEIGGYLLYVFLFVIGLPADLTTVIINVPQMFLFCLVMAGTNLVFTLVVGRLLRLNLEELLLSVNATIGGPPTAAAMAISKGWSAAVLPALLMGIWGYAIGTFLGVSVAEVLRNWLH